ncbi:MAG: hypothetical protein IJL43_00435 [Lachnospiraceae bacterium]|nr:hypothetical protein [Lachnospiraceae bacterium]
MNILAAILVTLFLAFIAAVLKVNHEAEYGDELGYRAGEPDEYPPTLGDEWNTEVEDIDE